MRPLLSYLASASSISAGNAAVIAEVFKRKASVYIYKTDETGEWLYAVALNEIPDFWMSSYKRKFEAVAYCRKHKLPMRRR